MSEKENAILKNIAGIRDNLARGTMIVRPGHRMKGVNPTGVAMELPLTPSQIREREGRLFEQEEALEKGHSRRKRYPKSNKA